MENRLPQAVIRARQMVRAGAERIRKKKTAEKLYVCDRCEKFFLLDSKPDSCPSCRRKYADQVRDLDTGEVFGGELSFREATKAERTVYGLKKNGGRKKNTAGHGALETLLRAGRGEEGSVAVFIMQMPDDM